MHFKFGEERPRDKAEVGDTVSLQGEHNKDLEVVECQETHVPMLNIDADEIQKGDLVFLKSIGLTISNPDTDKPVALGVDFKEDSFGSRLAKWFEENNDDDDSFFSRPSTYTPTPLFGGGSFGGIGGGFGGGFGGFGGGSFGGGGVSRGF